MAVSLTGWTPPTLTAGPICSGVSRLSAGKFQAQPRLRGCMGAIGWLVSDGSVGLAVALAAAGPGKGGLIPVKAG